VWRARRLDRDQSQLTDDGLCNGGRGVASDPPYPCGDGRLAALFDVREVRLFRSSVRGEVSTKSELDTIPRTTRRNRSWPEALKREIVAASFAPASSVSIVARTYDVNANMVFAWRKLYWDLPGPQLVPVVVTPDQQMAAPPAMATDAIEIELPRGYRVRIGGGVKAAALRLVLNALERR
jgi:transposase